MSSLILMVDRLLYIDTIRGIFYCYVSTYRILRSDYDVLVLKSYVVLTLEAKFKLRTPM